MVKRILAVQQSDLRMDNELAMNIRRVLPVTQADIDTAAALGKGWVVKRVLEVVAPLNNLRGGTLRVLKVNSVQPGENVLRVLIMNSGQVVVVGPGIAPLQLPDAMAEQISSLKAFGGTEQRNLPAEYTQLEYLGSNSQAYIDTGIAGGKDTLTIECKFMYNTFVAYGGIYGNYVSDSHNSIRCILANSENKIITNNTTICATTGNTELNCAISQIHTVISKHDTVILDGVATSIQNTVTGTENANNIALFNRSITNPNTSRDIGLRVYGFKIYDADVLVSNLIPCRRKSDSVLGMYDTVSGNFLTNQGTGTFTTGGEAVPTPDTPMDIVSNNGVLKARHQSGLPLGYTLLEYIESTGTQYIDTGVVPSTNMRSEIRGKFLSVDTTAMHILSARSEASGYNTMYAWNATYDGQYFSQFARNYAVVYGAKDTNVHTIVSVIKPTYTTITVDEQSATVQAENIAYSIPLTMNGRNLGDSVIDLATYRYNYVKIWKDDVLVRNFVPCKNSSNVVGMYDTVSGQFFTNAGTGDFVAGNAVSDPVEIYTDGTVETIAIKDDQNTTVSTATCEDLLSVGTYTDEHEVISGGVTRKVGVKVLDGTENWLYNSNYLRFNIGNFLTNSLATNSFLITHGVSGSQNHNWRILANNTLAFYDDLTWYADATAFKSWLADQYAAGTPVIIVYPLATATTETVTGQPMQTAAGDNTAEITQASMDGLELEVAYTKQ